ncbi:MAG TPA: metallophosphoesterase [archaeon]|nr:metallophosphoesterase [archaeon]
MKRISLLVLLAFLAFLRPLPLETKEDRDKKFSFGIVADIQYADKETQGQRRYREAIGKLAECVADWDTMPLTFTIQLGDIIDGNEDEEKTIRDLDKILAVFKTLEHKNYHVIGNHCLSVRRDELLKRLGLQEAWYEFTRPGWRFIVLDGMDISVAGWPGESDNFRKAREYLEANSEAQSYNGAIGETQKAWLENCLKKASERGEKVIVLCHLPVLEAASRKSLLLWNHAEILKIIESFPGVAAFFSGHDHEGGYAYQSGIHHVTLEGMVEAPEGGNAYGVVEVYGNRLVIKGRGSLSSRTLELQLQ